MTALLIAVGVLGWLMLAVCAAVDICGVIRARDRQVPVDVEHNERTRT